ncbi:hypothetical protein [Nonlabens ulvanivorans]
MLKPNILLFALLLSFIGFSQVGIGTVAPTADLEIMARTSLSAGEHNGIIIPKVTTLPATIAPSGTILYLEGGANAGFYFSNGSSFQNVTDILSASGTGAFYDRGTTTDVTVDTSSDSYRIGRTAFGQDSSNAAIVSIENETPAGGDKRLLDLENRNSSTAMGTNTSLINGSNTSTPGGQKAGALLNISSTGTGSHVGIENTVLVNNSSVVENYGIHNIIDGNSTATGTAYGIKSVTGNTNSSGIRYGVHSTVINDGSQNSYSGWFQGRSFAIRNQDATDGYDMPTISGNAGQVLTTDGSGTASWSDANSAGFKTNIRAINTGTALSTDHTLIISGDISIPDAVTSNAGQMYIIVLADGSNNLVVTASGNDFLYPGGSGTFGTFGLNDSGGGVRTITIQSDGTNWYIIDLLRN